ncbi:unnamed protein product [Adineta steineri]|uniref:Innexin n=1 Tax=Adineta steineri TaxID=433720 RepID=A0A815M1Z4_9BILA|nr:unnamed protein product [Adineta steineri]CAF1450180.1 unnamed protein product [Adineta steineri]CAF3501040.1 unnamed protein product [Adineta steineri]CAF3524717.1 unnamed protein product [Adineta steineri]CAF3549955.1 unnamed protein product [Adineta steineri]
MAEVVHRLTELTHLRISWFGCSDDDACNRLNHRHTVLMLLIFSAILTSRLFISDLIICWTPGEFTGNFVSYTRHYCYVTNTYYISMNETIPTLANAHIRRRRSIYYYQWLPILLAFQSLLFLIPRLLWSSFSSRCGINLQHCLSPKFDYRTSRYKVQHITTMLNLLARTKQHDFNRMTTNEPGGSLNSNSLSSHQSSLFKFLHMFCMPFIFLTGNSTQGYYLAHLFLIVKILFLLNSSLQLFFLNTLLTKNSIIYGLEVFDNFRRGEYVIGTRIFPLSVYCDFNIVKIGQPTLYTVQCLLPMNVFNEKIFTIIWFWLVFLTITNFNSLLLTIIRNSFNQFNYSYVANYLNLYSKTERFKRQILIKRFIFDYLSADGVLILRLISENISDLLTSEVVNELWTEYKKLAGLSAKNREKYLSSQRLKTFHVSTTSQSHGETTTAQTRDIYSRYSAR